MAMTTTDCLRIYEAMRVAGTKLMLDFTIRFSGAARAIKHRLRPLKGEPRSMYWWREATSADGIGILKRGEDRFSMLEFMPSIYSVGCMIQNRSKCMPREEG